MAAAWIEGVEWRRVEKRERERWRGIRWMAFTEARMIRRKVILLVVRQSSFPLNPHALLFIFVAILRATELCTPYYPHRRASFRALTTDVSWKIEIVNEILS